MKDKVDIKRGLREAGILDKIFDRKNITKIDGKQFTNVGGDEK